MKQTSEFRAKIKYLIYRFIKPRLADKLRNLYNLKDKFFYSKGLKKEVQSLIKARNKDVPISNDLNLLRGIHKLFPTYNLANNYKLNNLMNQMLVWFLAIYG